MEKFSFFVKNFIGKITLELALVGGLLLIAIGGVTLVALTLSKRNYTVKNRLWFLVYSASIILCFIGCMVVKKTFSGYLFVVFGEVVFWLAFLLFMPPKSACKKEEKELVRFIDSELKRAGINQEENQFDQQDFNEYSKENDLETPTPSKVKSILQSAEPKNSEKEDSPNFSHVKKIIEKLGFFPLTPSDKRQVKELEITIKRIEDGEDGAFIKNKANDALGALLKIMSKYGV